MDEARIHRLLVAVVLASSGVAPAAQIEGLTVSYSSGTFTIEATMMLQAPVAAVRTALTDFDHLGRLSPTIIESHLLRRDGDASIVLTRSRTCAGWFCRELRQTDRVTETEDTIVAVSDPTQSNVEHATARWHFVAVGDQTRIDWHLDVDPTFFVPPLIGPPIVKSAMKRDGEALAIGLERAARAIAMLPPLSAAAPTTDAAQR